MPSSTFYNLPQEKRDKLISAIKDEFSRVPFDEASINKIVQAADIPRGSFYQYFADKSDMLKFILTGYREKMEKFVESRLLASDGDIFATLVDMLDYTVDFVMGKNANSFCKNLFADVKVNSKFYLEMPKDDAGAKVVVEKLKSHINLEMLDLRSEDDFIYMMDILMSTCRDATAEVFLNISDFQNTKQKYLKKLELLKRGFLKKKE